MLFFSIETDQIEPIFWIFDLPRWSAKTTLFGILKNLQSYSAFFFHIKGTLSINQLCKECGEANKVSNAVKSAKNKTLIVNLLTLKLNYKNR